MYAARKLTMTSRKRGVPGMISGLCEMRGIDFGVIQTNTCEISLPIYVSAIACDLPMTNLREFDPNKYD